MKKPNVKKTAKIGLILKKARLKKGLTKKQAAKAVKLSEHYWGHIERGSLVPFSDSLLERLKSKFGSLRGLAKLIPAHNRKTKLLYKYYNRA